MPPPDTDVSAGRAASILAPFCREVIRLAGRRFWAALALMVIGGAVSGATVLLLVPLVQAAGLDVASGQETSGLFQAVQTLTGGALALPVALGLLLAAVVAQGGLRWAEVQTQTIVTQDVMLAIRQRLARRIFETEWVALSRRRSADLLEAMTRQVDRVGYAAHDVLGLAAAVVTTSIYVTLALWVSAEMTALVLVSGGGLSLALRGRRRDANAIGEALTSADRAFYREVEASLASLKLARTFDATDRQLADLDAAARPLRDVHVRLAGHPASVRLWFDSGIAAILCVSAYLGLTSLAMQPAELFVLLVLFMRLAPHLSLLQVYYQTLVTGLPAFEAVSRLEDELRAAAMPPIGAATPHRFRGGVALRGVTFSYGREPVLDNVTIEVPSGATVALVGASGAGKTTVADLVLGLLRPGQGDVIVDGQPLSRDLESAWRRAVGYVPQDAFLFHDSIRRNLIWAKPGATDDEVIAALQHASADFVLRLPDGLDTLVGDRGALLSAGQRQRLALARALLREPALLVLDEATSALDSENERAIQRALSSLHGRVTVLLIAHRLSTVREADHIYVLDGGRVAEAGTWAELMDRTEGRFRALCEAQGVTTGKSR